MCSVNLNNQPNMILDNMAKAVKKAVKKVAKKVVKKELDFSSLTKKERMAARNKTI